MFVYGLVVSAERYTLDGGGEHSYFESMSCVTSYVSY
jgi:hypothetical protein